MKKARLDEFFREFLYTLLFIFALVFCWVNTVSAETVYEADFSAVAQYSAYDLYGNPKSVLEVDSLIGAVTTESIDLKIGTVVVEMTFFPKHLDNSPAAILWYGGDTRTPFVKISPEGVSVSSADGYHEIFRKEEFILDWYTLKVFIDKSESVQVFLNDRQVIEKTSIPFAEKTAFSVMKDSSSQSSILLDSLIISKAGEVQIAPYGFLKNGVTVHRNTSGNLESGFSVYNGGHETLNLFFAYKVYDVSDAVEDIMLSKVTVSAGENADVNGTMYIDDSSINFVTAYLWIADGLNPLTDSQVLDIGQ